MGGALLQKLDRDTQKFAMKCSAARVDGRWIDVFKDPVTDPGKVSKKGRLDLVRGANGELQTRAAGAAGSELVEVFRDGKILVEWTLQQVREASESVVTLKAA